jgi:hypothetical protein
MKLGDIVSHSEICVREKRMLQHGMNFRNSAYNSVILMSRRPGAPYNDEIEDEGRTLIYEGHDVPKKKGIRDPKAIDQPRNTSGGKLTPNGKFEAAALAFKSGDKEAELVRVYEKIKDGIWTYNGVFRLVSAYQVRSGRRTVFKFRLELTDADLSDAAGKSQDLDHERLIPSAVKLEVYRRDQGKCVICQSTDNLHFDHDFPYSKGGTSISAKNIRLLCMRHNLAKSDRVE